MLTKQFKNINTKNKKDFIKPLKSSYAMHLKRIVCFQRCGIEYPFCHNPPKINLERLCEKIKNFWTIYLTLNCCVRFPELHRNPPLWLMLSCCLVFNGFNLHIVTYVFIIFLNRKYFQNSSYMVMKMRLMLQGHCL